MTISEDAPLHCLIVQPIAEAAVRHLREAGLAVSVAPSTDFAALGPLLAGADVVITRNHGLSAAEIAAAHRLKVVGVHGTGTERVHKPSLTERGILLTNTPGANAQSVAELAIALMLACSRSLMEADRASRTGAHDFRLTHRTFELSGRRLGLLGYGHIARLVGRMAQAFGMEVATYSRFTPAEDLAAEGIMAMPDIDALCEWSDILSLHAIPDAAPIINARRLALLGSEGYLVNTARGALVDEQALAQALGDGTIAGAGLDVTTIEPIALDHPLLQAPKLVLTPHIGGSTVEALEKTGWQVASNVLSALHGLRQHAG